MSSPLISVVLPVYNGEPYLAAAVESILRQDYKRFEIVAIDDGSNDLSLDILRRYQKLDDRVRIVSRENRGLIATLNEGIALARGDLVARMDADDISYPTRFSRQVSLFEQQPQLAICGTEVDRLLGNRVVRSTPNPIYQSGDWHILSLFFTIFLHSTVMYNRKIIPEDMLVYDASYVHAEDFDLFRRITRAFPAAMIDESLIAYRIHSDSVTNRHRRQMRRTHLKIVAENLERQALNDDPGALLAIGAAVTPETVRRAADCVLAIEGKVAEQVGASARSYAEGALCFFYFLYQFIADEQRPELTHAFLMRTGKWDVIRRRERYGLRAAVAAPWLSRMSEEAIRRLDGVARYYQSVPAKTVLPLRGLA
ncbi:Lacto-N-neotetraose biosynthesis glycosyl transferase LgtA (plasmid) [Neorhizobium galegae bv. officinalis bv. officinalis str. HAMBI 1141]|uniref:Lacto-N-neotetraose biosynthesis glycosyl transferase LgtA n=1 Tax=Neorhizobium galegae bv. officinalis bv. officinalis str. HAMBI 1141 TaxID=1028801 RepID=A0A068TGL3_NEOGA|nr:glycosyltransferase family 2 protein [Neorhizobium galegae]CDN57259.1 Lacto-N-neotetraose biosynthesis glycosyl transferase LgtA [Neorhizobium galegae bv. officinalis bv. officinalis str. HAMBI 1141]